MHHISNTAGFATQLALQRNWLCSIGTPQHRNQKAGFATLLRETVSPVTVSGTKGNGEDVTRSSGTHRPGSGDNNVLRCLVLLTLDVRHCEYQ